jgi:hypothetical protein
VAETLQWRGIRIEVAYEADWLNSGEGGYHTSHLAITSVEPAKAPLPITETGYRSHSLDPGTVEERGGPTAYVSAWLDDAATSKEWKAFEASRHQLDLFG